MGNPPRRRDAKHRLKRMTIRQRARRALKPARARRLARTGRAAAAVIAAAAAVAACSSSAITRSNSRATHCHRIRVDGRAACEVRRGRGVVFVARRPWLREHR